MPLKVDSYTPKAEADATIEERIESAKQFLGCTNARVTHRGNRAFYSSDKDEITLPPFAAFFPPVDHYSERAHETGHWTSAAVASASLITPTAWKN
jgi:antirestriction protein ArdC